MERNEYKESPSTQTLSFTTRRTEIAGCSVKELASRFGTPLFVYDIAKIRERLPPDGALRSIPIRFLKLSIPPIFLTGTR